MSVTSDREAARVALALVLLSSLATTAGEAVFEPRAGPETWSQDAGSFPSAPLVTGVADAGTADARTDGSAPPLPPKRPFPDYEGRDRESTATEDTLLFVPRALLYPVYLVNEYAVAMPVGAVATTAERNDWPKAIHDALTFGPNHEAGIYPTFLVDFGLRPSIGLHVFWGFPAVGNRVSLDAAWGGSQWYAVAVADRQDFSPHESLVTEFRWDRRPDNPYYGIGPEASDGLRSRVGTDVLEGSLTWSRVLGPTTLRARGMVRRVGFKDFTCCGDPALRQRVERGEVPPPPGYEQPYTPATLELAAVLDTRRPKSRNQSGWRVAIGAAPSIDLQRGGQLSWLRYGGAVEANWDVTGNGRVVSLGLITAFVNPLGSDPVPFTELVMLGGNEPFTGYLPGRVRDGSAVVAQLGWHWPVFSYLDGVLGVSFGNVFGKHLEGFDFNLLRLSAEMGLRTRGMGGTQFEFVLGIGTEPFREHLRLSSFRLAFGVSYGP